MGAATCQLPSIKDTLYLTSGFQDDFISYTDAQLWTKTLTDSGSVSVLATTGDNGILAIVPSDGSVADNDEAYVSTTNSPFNYGVNRMLQTEWLIQFTEANTDDCNMFVGFMNAVAANAIVDNGAGLKASGTFACIYKVDGETVFRCMVSIGSTQSTTTTAITAGGASYQRLKVEIRGLSTTQAEVTYWYDNGGGMVQFLDPAQKVATPIKHVITYTGFAAMQAAAGVKNGGANLETLNVDFMSAYQTRKSA